MHPSTERLLRVTCGVVLTAIVGALLVLAVWGINRGVDATLADADARTLRQLGARPSRR